MPMKNLITAIIALFLYFKVPAQVPTERHNQASGISQQDTGNDQIVTSVVIIDDNELITVSPNPNSGSFTLMSATVIGKTLTITNNAGSVVLQMVLTSPAVDVSSLQSGQYWFVISGTNYTPHHGSFTLQH